MDCLFCGIVAGSVPSKRAYEDDRIIAFHDIAPAAPVHVLVIPRAHIESAAALEPRHAALMGHVWTVIPEIARNLGVGAAFRVVTNSGAGAGQTVPHLHFHILGGRELGAKLV